MTKPVFIILAMIGGVVIAFIMLMMTYGVCELIVGFIKSKAYEYKRNHRFDKPPIAKCYCKDCVYASAVNFRCDYKNNHGYDAWFCADATPRTHDPDPK